MFELYHQNFQFSRQIAWKPFAIKNHFDLFQNSSGTCIQIKVFLYNESYQEI